MASDGDILDKLRMGRVDPDQQSLFEFRSVGFTPDWSQMMLAGTLSGQVR